ncbi:MAG: bifunctional adenosylcobinamide kinase/adenosylcobinamide-phosphate guanylyltransferase [Firmicutes bacterium]|nr:bifunctional adenosylcobinamide kinase/adenosylcobinamide-phosphate guanylyltransferase [Bacillota bacterium]
MQKEIILVIGGSGSGKSKFAENLAAELKNKSKTEKMYYMATMKPYGEEGKKRVQKHRKQRRGKGFETVECYGTGDGSLSSNRNRCQDGTENRPLSRNSVVLLECMSNLAANEVFDEKNKNAADDILSFINGIDCKALVIVTNEIFSDGILYGEETVEYIKILGDINQRLAQIANAVFEVVCGIPVKLK